MAKSALIEYNTKAENAHELTSRGDPRVNGPWLDEIREEEEEAYRGRRNKALKKAKKLDDVSKEQQKLETEVVEKARVEALGDLEEEQEREEEAVEAQEKAESDEPPSANEPLTPKKEPVAKKVETKAAPKKDK